ncbi:Chaperone protein [Nymphaea thermarum]|nr:Chaperone protein [Nymphaea thermarum]
MRAGLSTILQTLTPEAASVLNHSIADAGRRGHSQTTPLHVAATLLSSPAGFLKQACIRSHPNSSHPLQCRALELCFTVALDRLPASGSALSHVAEPPISNALMAALKRAQAHQRRGCPEQQQQPLLAVKVELEQLVISILDDPSVSRVMREASFSSPAVKATIEQTLANSPSNSQPAAPSPAGFSLGSHRPIPMRNSYLNPRLQASASIVGDRPLGGQRAEEVKKLVDILQRAKKRNPVLVGDHEPEAVMKELLLKIERKEVGEVLKEVQVISVEKELSSMCAVKGEERGRIGPKIKELGALIESKMSSHGGVILNLGDLRWLVEQAGGGSFGVSVSGPVQDVVSEMAKLLGSHGEGGKVWLMATATCETYIRCRVYHPTVENEWDLQAVPIAARSPHPGLFQRIGGNGILSSSVESLSPIKGLQGNPFLSRKLAENGDSGSARKMNCCPSCMENYEKELANLVADVFEKSASDAKQEEQQNQQQLPQWLQLAKSENLKANDQSTKKENQDQIWRQKSEELQKKWNETCSRLHPRYHPVIGTERPSSLTFTPLLGSQISTPLLGSQISGNGSAFGSVCNSNSVFRPQLQPKLQASRNTSLQLGTTTNATLTLSSEPAKSPPASPVRTELVLSQPKLPPVQHAATDARSDRPKDLTSSTPTQAVSGVYNPKISPLDADSFKRLFKGLTQTVSWQTEAATTVATVVTKSRSSERKQRGMGLKGDTWLLFLGPDRVGKKKMAAGLSELVFGNRPTTIRLGLSDNGHHHEDEDDEPGPRFRGRTVLDRIADAVRRNPFSVVVLEDIDQADSLIHGHLIRAMDKGRLPDSHGREVSLGSVIFILTAEWLPESLGGKSPDADHVKEDKLAAAATCFRPLQLTISSSLSATGRKRRPAWLEEEESQATRKPRGIDLNLMADDNVVVDASHGSRDSSDVTVETALRQPPGLMKELVDRADEAIAFKPVDFDVLSNRISYALSTRFTCHVGRVPFEVDEHVVEQLLGSAWFGPSSSDLDQVDDWADRVLVPVFRELKAGLPAEGEAVVRLVLSGSDEPIERPAAGNWLPSKIPVCRS